MIGSMSRLFLAGTLMLGLSSCAMFRGGGGWGAVPAGPALGQLPPSAAEAALTDIVGEYVAEENRRAESTRGELVRARPYYYRAYAKYPDAPITPRLTETESRTAPYRADVTLPKIRFATRLHSERDRAFADAAFLRQIGEETLTYAYRNGRWTRLGSVFIADITEEEVDGEWRPARAKPAPVQADTAPGEPRPGWFKRTWSRLFGG